jgi:hypothetical protein
LSAWLGHSMQSIAKAKRVPKGWDMVWIQKDVYC